MTGRVALIGDPVHESVSPAMQNAAFRALGLDLEYSAVRVPREEFTSAFPRLVRELRGMNVTIPLKEAAALALDELGDEAREAMSVNTVVVRDGRAIGRSTDGEGFLRALRRAQHEPRDALVLGAGGAARAIAYALARTGARVVVAARDLDAAATVAPGIATAIPADDVGRHLAALDLVVSAIPGDAWRDAEPFPISSALHPAVLVADLAYRPRLSPLLLRALDARCKILPGVEMLIEQGALSFTLWTDRAAPVDVMRGAAYDALGVVGAVAT